MYETSRIMSPWHRRGKLGRSVLVTNYFCSQLHALGFGNAIFFLFDLNSCRGRRWFRGSAECFLPALVITKNLFRHLRHLIGYVSPQEHCVQKTVESENEIARVWIQFRSARLVLG